MLIRKNLYLEAGGLNPIVGFYGEEPEFCYKLKQRGYETWLYPFASIIHLGGRSTDNNTKALLEKEEISFQNYCNLAKATYGYEKNARHLKVGVLILKLKLLIAKGKTRDFLRVYIAREKRLLNYMQNLQKKESVLK